MPGRFRGLVLVAASVQPQAAMLRGAGIRRVALLAGEWDGSRASMEATAARLSADGIEARYASLGRFGHVIPDSTSGTIADAIAWAAQAP
jgi:hypothetical protein